MCENMLWFLLFVVFPVVENLACSQLEISADVEEYNITSYSEDDCCSCIGCARKCCADGFAVLLKERKCSRNVSGNFSAFIYDQDKIHNGVKNLNFINGFLKCPSYFLEPENYEDDVFFLLPDGRLWLKNSDVYRGVKDYCVDYVDDIGFTAFVCFSGEITAEKLYRRFNEISKSFIRILAKVTSDRRINNLDFIKI